MAYTLAVPSATVPCQQQCWTDTWEECYLLHPLSAVVTPAIRSPMSTVLQPCRACLQDRAAALAAAGGAPTLASAGSASTAATAVEVPAGRSHSSPEVELLQVLPASRKSAGSAQQQPQEEQQLQLRSRAVSLDSGRDATAADNAATSSVAQQQQNCGNPLKGLFACQCAAPAGVDKPVDELHS
jgi:hypothetical protein